jgi:hypothetical protein
MSACCVGPLGLGVARRAMLRKGSRAGSSGTGAASGSRRAAGLLEDAQVALSPPLPVTWLHRLETINAFQLHVFGGKSHGHTRITSEQAAAAHATFRTDLARPEFLRSVELSLAELQVQFEELALRHTAKHGFRTYDLLHVASAPPVQSRWRLVGCWR